MCLCVVKKEKFFGRFCCVSATPFGRIGSEIRLDAKLDYFGRNNFWTGQDLQGVDLRIVDFRTFEEEISPDERNRNVSRTRSWTKKKTKFEIIWKNFEKNEFARENEKCPRAPEKK